MPAPRPPVPGAVATALLTLALAATGCASSEERDVSTIAERPSLEATVARYEEMQARIRDGLDGVLGRRRWFSDGHGDLGGCGPARSDAERRILPRWTFDGGISATDWPRARIVVNSITAEYGFTDGGATADRPDGSHTLSVLDPDLQASYALDSAVNTVMQVTTGCHLPEAARPKP